MTTRFTARVRVTNAGGIFDSRNPASPEDPRIAFSVRKTLEPTPNSAEIRIYNLSPKTVDRIAGVVRTRVDFTPEQREALLAAGASAQPAEIIADNNGYAAIELSWGYEGVPIGAGEIPAESVGFVGQSHSIRTVRDGLDSITTILATDSGHTLGAAEVVQRAGVGAVTHRSKPYAAGTDVRDIVEDLINACGLYVDRPKLDNTIANAVLRLGEPIGKLILPGGFTASGPAVAHLRGILEGLQLRWSIQDGEFLLLDVDTTIPGLPPLELAAANGTLWGPPEILQANQLAALTWANPDARPGRRVEVRADLLQTSYRIEAVEHEGDLDTGGSTRLTLDALQSIPGVV